jgi:hypothetical protein
MQQDANLKDKENLEVYYSLKEEDYNLPILKRSC